MNERIRELHSKVVAESENMRWNIEDSEKFAQLIVEECCDKFVSMQYKYPVSISAYEIKKHFGVES